MTIPKFRAWDKDSQKMNGNVEIYINKDKTIEIRPKDDKTIIMQSTSYQLLVYMGLICLMQRYWKQRKI